MNIKKFLNAPIPVLPNKVKFLYTIFLGVFIHSFLIIFQPLFLGDLIRNHYFFISGFSIIASVIFYFYITVVYRLFPKHYSSDSWNVGKQIWFVTYVIFTIAVVNYFYNTYVGQGISTYEPFLWFLKISIEVGVLPTILLIFFIMIFFNYDKMNYEIGESLELKDDDIDKINILNTVKLTSKDVNAKVLEVDINDLLYIKSEDNYCDVFYLDDNKMTFSRLRIKLKDVEKQLLDFDFFIRCHRSYIVNKLNIDKVTGNSKTKKIHLKGASDTIPISRSLSKEKLQLIFELINSRN
jgi:hypothetical protein